MYIPEHFRVRNHADALAFMRANPFAIVISTTANGPFATHAPLAIDEINDQLLIRGHVAKANPHWKYLDQQPQCLTIFHGAHAYISPTNYTTRESVPTWNYGAVHVYGAARTFSAHEELLGVLHELMNTFDPTYAQQWASLSESYRERMLNQIVGFEITAKTLEAKFKLSQNRTREEQSKIISSLKTAPDTAISGLAQLMRAQGLRISKRED